MPVNFSGISSGLDTKAIIDATIAAQRLPVKRLESRKSAWQTQISSLGKLASKLDELKKLAKDLKDVGNVLAVTSKVVDEDVLTNTVAGGATAGRYELTVTQLARAEKDRSVAFASPLSQVKSGALTITTPGKDPVEIVIDEGDNLQDVVDKINASDARVDAAIVRTGNQSFLQLVAADSGHEVGQPAANAITVSEVYGSGGGTELGLSEVVTAQNALLQIDGLPVEHRQNHITDVLPGLTLDLKKAGTTAIDIASNASGTKDKMQSFVKLANEVLDLVRGDTRTSDGARKDNSDPAVERLLGEIRSLVGSPVVGLSGRYASPAGIGLETNSSGKFELDTKVFDEALAKDALAVSKLFTQSDTGIGARLETALERWTDPIDGIIAGRKKALNARMSDADRQIDRMEGRLDKMQTTLQRQFTRMEQALGQIQQQGAALIAMFGR